MPGEMKNTTAPIPTRDQMTVSWTGPVCRVEFGDAVATGELHTNAEQSRFGCLVGGQMEFDGADGGRHAREVSCQFPLRFSRANARDRLEVRLADTVAALFESRKLDSEATRTETPVTRQTFAPYLPDSILDRVDFATATGTEAAGTRGEVTARVVDVAVLPLNTSDARVVVRLVHRVVAPEPPTGESEPMDQQTRVTLNVNVAVRCPQLWGDAALVLFKQQQDGLLNLPDPAEVKLSYQSGGVSEGFSPADAAVARAEALVLAAEVYDFLVAEFNTEDETPPAEAPEVNTPAERGTR